MTPYIRELIFYSGCLQIGVSTILGICMLIRIFRGTANRFSYGLFSVSWFFLALIELSRVVELPIGPDDYEKLRLVWGWIFMTAIAGLFDTPKKIKYALVVGYPLVTVPVWNFNWLMTTSIIFPTFVFGTAAVVSAINFKQKKGFASLILCSTFVALALSCAFFYSIFMYSNTHQTMMPFIKGYLHYGFIMVISVFMGWRYFLREAERKHFVDVKMQYAYILIPIVAICEIICYYDLTSGGTTKTFVLTGLTQLLVFSAVSWIYGEDLNKHTESVDQLLDENRKALKTIERQRRLEAAAKTSGGVAHDMQNQLNVLSQKVKSIIKRDYNAPKNKEEFINIRNGIEALREVCSNMLGLSVLGMTLETDVNIKKVVDSLIVDDVVSNINFNVQVNEAFCIRANFGQISRMMSILINNAIESYGDHIGFHDLDIEVHECEFEFKKSCYLGVLDPGKYMRISIRDYGCGIPEDIKEKIFMLHYSTKKSATAGTGIGLSSLREFAKDANCVIDCESQVGRGTTFSLYFSNFSYSRVDVTTEEFKGSELIALIDDNVEFSEDLAGYFEEHGYEVDIYDSGRNAVLDLQRSVPDLIILDYEMPGMNGEKTREALMHIVPGVKTIILSSYVSFDAAKKLKTMGVMGFLDKKMPKDEILKNIRFLLNVEIESNSGT